MQHSIAKLIKVALGLGPNIRSVTALKEVHVASGAQVLCQHQQLQQPEVERSARANVKYDMQPPHSIFSTILPSSRRAAEPRINDQYLFAAAPNLLHTSRALHYRLQKTSYTVDQRR